MPYQEKGMHPSLHNQSTEKALRILELLAESPEPMRLRDLSTALELNPSTALRFLSSLQSGGYVQQEPDTQRYFLTFKLCRLAHLVSARSPLPTVTHPYLQRLSAQFQEALCVSVEQDMHMVYVDVASSPEQTLLSVQRIGNVSPMHCTGNGKLMLLNYSPEQLDRLAQTTGLPRYTANTVTTREALDAAIRRIRQDGFAYDNEECEIGVRCLSYPLYDYTGRIVAGMCVTGPVSRMTDEALAPMHPQLRQAAQEISRLLGYAGDFNN